MSSWRELVVLLVRPVEKLFWNKTDRKKCKRERKEIQREGMGVGLVSLRALTITQSCLAFISTWKMIERA